MATRGNGAELFQKASVDGHQTAKYEGHVKERSRPKGVHAQEICEILPITIVDAQALHSWARRVAATSGAGAPFSASPRSNQRREQPSHSATASHQGSARDNDPLRPGQRVLLLLLVSTQINGAKRYTRWPASSLPPPG